jgi:hypothetical protein
MIANHIFVFAYIATAILSSTNAIAPAYEYTGISVSQNGTDFVIVASGTGYGGIIISRDLGLTWQKTKAPQGEWSSVSAVVADGQQIVAASSCICDSPPVGVYTSLDFGLTWKPTPITPQEFNSVAGAGKVLFIF